MNTHKFERMMFSYSEGWGDLLQMDPKASRMAWMYVVPMSLIPVAMFMYAMLVTPGAVLPALTPAMSLNEVLAVGAVFFVFEIGMVALMASIIQQMGDVVDSRPDYHHAYMLAAIAPTPLWLAPLALFVPSAWFNGLVLALAWFGSAALIYHGVEPLFRLEGHSRARLMGSVVMLAGVVAWAALMVVLSLILSLVIGLR